MSFAKVVFLVAGVWGVLVVTPLFFLFGTIGRLAPPPITHPDFYYGFAALAFAWQLAFLLIATDPVRFRPLMVPSMVEKFGYVIACSTLAFQGRFDPKQLVFVGCDVLWGVLFAVAFFRTPPWNKG